MSSICGSGVDEMVYVQERGNNPRKQRSGSVSAPQNQKGENLMKNKLLVSMVAVSTLLMVPAIGFAGDKSAEVCTLTGCLSKAEGAHEYKLTTENGGTWELHSKTVKLSPHAGHTVTVTAEFGMPACMASKRKPRMK
jgi:hypothetical protein